MSTPKFINVIDVEATCWQDEPPNDVMRTPRNEIIEVGITKIDIATRELIVTRSIIVLPVRTEVSEFCTQLTTLTPEFVSKFGIPFRDMCNILSNEFKSDSSVFASFGDYDKDIFKRNCIQNKVAYPLGRYHLNVKSLFVAKMGFSLGAKKACEYMGIKFEGTHHRGSDDSLNIAKLLLKLL